MKLKFILIAAFLLSTMCFGQISEVHKHVKKIQFTRADSLIGWKKQGALNINLNQSLYKDWQSGQSNAVEVTSHLNYNLTYQKERLLWDNYLILDYGLNKLKDYEIRKTIDKLEINSIVGGELPKNWSYSFFINLQTQLTNTYNYDKDSDKAHRIAGFLAPLYLTSGPGILWRRDENFNFNLAPFTTKLIYINGMVHTYDKDSETFVNNKETVLFGIDPGEHFLYKFGFYASAYYNFQLLKNVHVNNRFSMYSNYLSNGQNFDIDYATNIEMKINPYLNSNLRLQLRYDDNEDPGFQLRESFGLGITLKL